jgi:ATP phosphoribosyltransferase regulatory subunit HisZ
MAAAVGDASHIRVGYAALLRARVAFDLGEFARAEPDALLAHRTISAALAANPAAGGSFAALPGMNRRSCVELLASLYSGWNQVEPSPQRAENAARWREAFANENAAGPSSTPPDAAPR